MSKTKTNTAGFTLKGFKHAKFASQETNCFEATLCFEGKPVAHAFNEGHGGCNLITLNEAGRKNPHIVALHAKGEFEDGSLDRIIDALVDEAIFAKEKARLERKVAKDLATTVLFTRKGDKEGQFRTLRQKFPTAEQTKAEAAKFAAQDPTVDKVLNLMPFEQAFNLLVSLS